MMRQGCESNCSQLDELAVIRGEQIRCILEQCLKVGIILWMSAYVALKEHEISYFPDGSV